MAFPLHLYGAAIPLVIDNPSKLDEPWPLTCGVPFPKGRFKDARLLRLETEAGETVPCQIDKTATWLDGSIRWLLLNFQGNPGKSYVLKTGKARQPVSGIQVKETDDGHMLDTGPAQFWLAKDDALISRATVGAKVVLADAGKGAYVIDNQGREARLGGKNSEMETRFQLRGPLCAVLRKEGWYVVPGTNTRIARGIVWLYFFHDSPYVKVVHRLILTEDTNKVWFKDIGIDFPTRINGKIEAVFDVSPEVSNDIATVPIGPEESAWMMQDDFPHFCSTNSHFSVVHRHGSKETEILSGAVCGDWCSACSTDGGLTVVLRYLAEQFPKEFTISPQKITAHLWAGRCGRELDFRTKTLTKEHWQEWCDYAPGGAEALRKYPSNAQCSAKTHTLWLLPHAGPIDRAILAQRAHAASKRVLVIADPKWTCETTTLGPPMRPKDNERFPEQEEFISDFYDRMALALEMFPYTGYISWGAAPAVRIGRDSKTGNWYAIWWRSAGTTDYEVKRHLWTLYARSGDRKYFEHGEAFNRFLGDMFMQHWDVGKPGDMRDRNGKFKGGYILRIYPLGLSLPKIDSLPLYWNGMSHRLGETYHYLSQFYLTGDWDMWEYAEDHEQAVKKYSFIRPTEPARGAAVPLRLLAALYSIRWDEQIGECLRNLAHKVIDLESPNAIYEETSPHALYKVSRNVIPMYEYCNYTGDEHGRLGLIKMLEYEYRFERLGQNKPISYRNGAAMSGAILHQLTGKKKYLSIVRAALENGLRQWKEDIQGGEPIPPDPRSRLEEMPGLFAAQFNYHTCLGLPIALREIADYDGPPPRLYPVVRKNNDSTSKAWAVFNKEKGKAVHLDMRFTLIQDKEVKPVLIGPDLRPVTGIQTGGRRKGIVSPFSPGFASWFMELTVPAHLPAGTYRIGHENIGAFTVLEADVDKMVIECPEGFWVRGPVPFYFRVPEPVTNVNLFVSAPVIVKRSDGSTALDGEYHECGNQSLPVDGKTRFWNVSYSSWARIRLDNLPNVVSYLTPDRFFVPDTLMELQERRPRLPDPKAGFVDGISGQGLQLNGKDGLKFARGKRLDDESWENFPGRRGTIEFWFRPNWSAVDIKAPTHRYIVKPLLSAGVVSLDYRIGPHRTRCQRYVYFTCGRSRKPNAKKQYARFGTGAIVYPGAGEWLHIAAVWDKDNSLFDTTGKNMRLEEHFYLYINGKRHLRTISGGRLRHYLGEWFVKDHDLSAIAEWIQIQPADGTFDELRVSDAVRYMNDFIPQKKPFTPDDHTKALFHFDGSTEALGMNGTGPHAVEVQSDTH